MSSTENSNPALPQDTNPDENELAHLAPLFAMFDAEAAAIGAHPYPDIIKITDTTRTLLQILPSRPGKDAYGVSPALKDFPLFASGNSAPLLFALTRRKILTRAKLLTGIKNPNAQSDMRELLKGSVRKPGSNLFTSAAIRIAKRLNLPVETAFKNSYPVVHTPSDRRPLHRGDLLRDHRLLRDAKWDGLVHLYALGKDPVDIARILRITLRSTYQRTNILKKMLGATTRTDLILKLRLPRTLDATLMSAIRQLSPKDKAILDVLATGASIDNIAAQFNRQKGAVGMQLERIMEKLGLNGRKDELAVLYRDFLYTQVYAARPNPFARIIKEQNPAP